MTPDATRCHTPPGGGRPPPLCAACLDGRPVMTQGPLPVDWHGQQAVVSMPDEVDMANGAAIQEGLLAALAQRPAVLVVDMTQTTFCDSAGVRAIMLTHRQAAAAGCQLRLVIGSPAVTRVFTIIGAGQLVPIHPDLAAALAAAPTAPDDGPSAQTGS